MTGLAADGEPDGRIESDVVVIGGGLVGLTLGVALVGAGIETVVVDGAAPEAMRDAAFDGRVSSIALGSKCVLDGIGLWPAAPSRSWRSAFPTAMRRSSCTTITRPRARGRSASSSRTGPSATPWARAAALPALRHLAPASVEALGPADGATLARLADGR